MAKRQERPGAGDSEEVKPRSKRRADKPAKGYRPNKEQDDLGIKKGARRPDVDDDDDYLEDLEDEEFEDDEDFDDFDEDDFEDEDFQDDDFTDYSDEDDLA